HARRTRACWRLVLLLVWPHAPATRCGCDEGRARAWRERDHTRGDGRQRLRARPRSDPRPVQRLQRARGASRGACARSRAGGRDLALRFKYAGLARERMEVVDEWSAAIDRATALAPQGAEVVVLATYTAMQALRAVLSRAGAAVPFWED